MENELLRERGLWGPPLGSWLDKWMLDMVEGPCRMRKKMVKNDMFYVHYPYRPDMEDSVSTVFYLVRITKLYHCHRVNKLRDLEI